ncbi:hypothetical protein A3B02_01675 [Candidatus Roizmanbacteria bacterium RIFCSPLOWO2_01_FULL_42_14]|uniref:Large ribosomal subunit protein bL27 n=2 Tax=Candidatus Roizmaniibacteriota TaxID=1752723 RepID=A0A1F7J7G0_9BACT|nr:MAG: hypothetical protein A3F32_01775 [Candidatus Roizmanbacteria bacterium RIFCSPHIGHO2_12_FULL_42_10]OGK51550.1 MAG: hypothetical protein A3B02_01675 [Candidatus Roizmanbacteria bacterium RIFCSPLOWO2_01_FULL_42_14]
MAHTKSQKAARGNKDSKPKMLGVKLYGGEAARAGNIIARQRGMTFASGVNTYMSKDFTIHAQKDGVVKFITREGKKLITVVQQ